MTAPPNLEDFPCRTFDKLRYGDTDRQGHVNNAVFATFFETGRVELLNAIGWKPSNPDVSYVIARLVIDFRAEIFWPGTVEIGTAISAIGNSSTVFTQALYQGEKCVATASSVVVQVDNTTHRATPIDPEARRLLSAWLLPPEPG
ncbi:MAG: thioesterase [Acidocella sp. 20-63-7]|nr:MAG: thioesterase [Acidocella sp. 20-63-7]HQT45973.1 thioesterase family protein [Acidocella sp.]